MKEKLEKITSDSKHLRKKCNLCDSELQVEDEVVECPRCHEVHHADCWKNKGGCATPGCPQIAEAVVGEKPKGDGPPPPVPKWYFAVGAAVIIGIILISVFWPKPPDPAMGRDRIVIMTESYIETSAVLEELVDEFNSVSEDTYIDLQLLPGGGMEQKLVVLIAAGDAPDIFTVDENRFAYLNEQNVLLQLGEDQGEPVFGIQNPAALNQFVIWGGTEYPETARAILNYLVENIPPRDLEELRKIQSNPIIPMMGF